MKEQWTKCHFFVLSVNSKMFKENHIVFVQESKIRG